MMENMKYRMTINSGGSGGSDMQSIPDKIGGLEIELDDRTSDKKNNNMLKTNGKTMYK